MTSNRAVHRTLYAGLASLALACGRGGVDVTLENRGAARLDSVAVVTTGHRYTLGELPAGGSRTVRVEADGDSHVEVEHGRGARRRLVVDTYFGPGARGTVRAELTADTVLSVTSQVR